MLTINLGRVILQIIYAEVFMKTKCLFLLVVLFSPLLPLHASTMDALCKISHRADESNSDSVLVFHNSNLIGSYGKQKKFLSIESRSVTKSFVALAIGFLIQEGKIESIDTPVYTYFPEWKQGCKQEVTLRHLLNHTSGIYPDEEVQRIYCFPNIVQMALVADLTAYPGKEFHYNNIATNLLAGIVQKISGMSLSEYLDKCLFKPLNIQSVNWLCDQSGNNFGMSHLSISAADLGKVGIMMAMRGCWGGEKILSEEWIDFMTKASQQFNPFYGQLCWLGYDSMNIFWDESMIKYYEMGGLSSRFICALNKLNGLILYLQCPVTYGTFHTQMAKLLAEPFGGESEVYAFFAEVESKGLPLGRWNAGNIIFYAMKGYQGQQLIVMPEYNLIGVRLSTSCGSNATYNPDAFPDFELLLYALSLEYQTLDPCTPDKGPKIQ